MNDIVTHTQYIDNLSLQCYGRYKLFLKSNCDKNDDSEVQKKAHESDRYI